MPADGANSGASAPVGRPDIAESLRQIHELVAAIVDSLDSLEAERYSANASQASPDVLRPQLERLASEQEVVHDYVAAIADTIADQPDIAEVLRSQMEELISNQHRIEGLVSALTVSEAALREEIAELRRRPPALDATTLETLAAAVAERVRGGPGQPPPSSR